MSSLSKKIEDRIGLFDIAISFADEVKSTAEITTRIFAAQHIRAYHYLDHLADQAGLDIYSVMDFVFSASPYLLILNSPGYLSTKFTLYEFEAIRRNTAAHVYVWDLGGRGLALPANLRVSHLSGSSTAMLIEMATKMHRR